MAELTKKQVAAIKAEGHFQSEAFFLKRLIKQAISFVGKGFSLYQSELEETCVFESKDGKRIAIVMGWLKTAAIKLLNDVDMKGEKKWKI